MPIYEYKCECGGEFERFLSLENYRQPQKCACGRIAEKVMSAPMVRGDYPGYNCPITGDWIEGRRAHEENLRKHGCRVLEPGENEEVSRRRAAADAKLDAAVEETAAEFVEKLPQDKREALETGLANGLDVTVDRVAVGS